MSLADEYRRQARWRSWVTILDALPPLTGRTVVDLGCGIGDQAAALVSRGARVIGVDANPELLLEARSRGLPNAEFVEADLRTIRRLPAVADGLWCSFAAAYFPDLAGALRSWVTLLQPDGWVALTEIDDLFGHEPLDARARSLFDAYAAEALAAGRYDFHMGRKLPDHLARAGLLVSRTFDVADREFSFEGAADAGVIDAWQQRLERMTALRHFCGREFGLVREAFLDCLRYDGHHSAARVVFCLGVKA